jgi:hypothetical protein
MVPSALFPNTLNLNYSFNVRDQVSHQYKTEGKITLLYILIFMFLGSRQQNNTWREAVHKLVRP